MLSSSKHSSRVEKENQHKLDPCMAKQLQSRISFRMIWHYLRFCSSQDVLYPAAPSCCRLYRCSSDLLDLAAHSLEYLSWKCKSWRLSEQIDWNGAAARLSALTSLSIAASFLDTNESLHILPVNGPIMQKLSLSNCLDLEQKLICPSQLPNLERLETVNDKGKIWDSLYDEQKAQLLSFGNAVLSLPCLSHVSSNWYLSWHLQKQYDQNSSQRKGDWTRLNSKGDVINWTRDYLPRTDV